MKLQYFDTPLQALESAVDALRESLEDDTPCLTWTDERVYSGKERQQEQTRLNDLQTVLPLMGSVLEMHTLLKQCLCALNETPRFQVSALNNQSSYELASKITRLLRRFEPNVSPIQLAKEATPFWFQTIHSYDGLELAPVAETADKRGGKYCERVDDPQAAQFWSVYGHLSGQGVECLEDFPTEQEAVDFAEQLLSLYPNLKVHGLMRC